MEPGTTDEPTKECSAATSANNVLGGRHGFSHNVGTSVSRTCAVIAELSKSVQDRAPSPCRLVSQTVGSDGGSVPCSSAGPAPHAAVSVVDQGPEHFTSLSSASQNYGDTQRFSCSKAVEKTPVPSERSPAGGGCLHCKTITMAMSLTGWGGGPSRTPSPWSLVRGTSELAHKSFGTTGSLPGSQTVLTAVDGLSCVSQDGQHDRSFLPESSRRITFSPLYRLARSVLLWAQTKFLSIRAVHDPGHLNSGADLLSRQKLEDGEWRLHSQVVDLVWQRFSAGDSLESFF